MRNYFRSLNRATVVTVSERKSGLATVLDLERDLTFSDGTATLRRVTRRLIAECRPDILHNLARARCVDVAEPATVYGGAYYGDSGGPTFLNVGGQRVLVAITVTGDPACRATNAVYRPDAAWAQAFCDYVNAEYGTHIPTSC